MTELNGSDKVGSGGQNIWQNLTVGPLDRVRVDATGRVFTTNQGVPIPDNQHSLKAGLRGPTLLEDFVLREKITHVDHERIPERIAHARGSGAHGFFECTKSLSEFHCKPILAVGASDQLLTACGIDAALPDGQPDPGVITTSNAGKAGDAFIAAIAKHRHFARDTDPPRV